MKRNKKIAKSVYSWISDKIHQTKFKKSAFLKTSNTETFDLHLSFEDDKDEIKSYLTENERDQNPEQFVKAVLKGVQPRSRENAKKIIEHETYIFTKPYTYEDVLKEVEEHIKNKMFPDVEETDKFEFKAVFKHNTDAKKQLKRGLNKIELVLNPKRNF